MPATRASSADASHPSSQVDYTNNNPRDDALPDSNATSDVSLETARNAALVLVSEDPSAIAAVCLDALVAKATRRWHRQSAASQAAAAATAATAAATVDGSGGAAALVSRARRHDVRPYDGTVVKAEPVVELLPDGAASIHPAPPLPVIAGHTLLSRRYDDGEAAAPVSVGAPSQPLDGQRHDGSKKRCRRVDDATTLHHWATDHADDHAVVDTTAVHGRDRSHKRRHRRRKDVDAGGRTDVDAGPGWGSRPGYAADTHVTQPTVEDVHARCHDDPPTHEAVALPSACSAVLGGVDVDDGGAVGDADGGRRGCGADCVATASAATDNDDTDDGEPMVIMLADGTFEVVGGVDGCYN